MTPKIPTAKGLLEMILDGTGLSVPAEGSQQAADDGLRELALQCVEQILSRPCDSMNSADEVLGYVFQQFYREEDGGVFTPHPQTPFDNPAELSTLTPSERRMAEALRRVARLAPFLTGRRPFDLAMVGVASKESCPGLSEEDCFSVRNERLVGFLQQTPYRHLAARVALCMLEAKTLQEAELGDWMLQDYLAFRGFDIPWNRRNGMDQEEVVSGVLLLLGQVDRYEQAAAERCGMSVELRRVYDLLVGCMREEFDEALVGIARKLLAQTERPADSARAYRDRFLATLADEVDASDYIMTDTGESYLDSYLREKCHDRFGEDS